MHVQSIIRVLLVDDSALARNLLRDILEQSGDIQVVGEAANGQEAVLLARQLKPDVICMDLEMPVMNGTEAIDAIMHEKAIPILVVSAQSNAQKAYQALSTGALDVLAKPTLESSDTTTLINKVRLLAGVSVITRMRRAGTLPARPRPEPAGNSQTPTRIYRHLVAIACSTGGPQALAWLLPRLDPGFAAPILISQHMSDGFVDGLVQWLDSLSGLPVKVARQGETLRGGHVYISPSEQHMTVNQHACINLLPRQPQDIYRPCCDLMLESVAHTHGADSIGLIMTGMGHDGVRGMQAIHNSGGYTLAQDEASSVIFGMNQEAIAQGTIDEVLSLEQIPRRLSQLVSGAP